VELQKRLGSVEKDLETAEESWLTLHDELDRAQLEAQAS
jgi:hypothetical protein